MCTKLSVCSHRIWIIPMNWPGVNWWTRSVDKNISPWGGKNPFFISCVVLKISRRQARATLKYRPLTIFSWNNRKNVFRGEITFVRMLSVNVSSSIISFVMHTWYRLWHNPFGSLFDDLIKVQYSGIKQSLFQTTYVYERTVPGNSVFSRIEMQSRFSNAQYVYSIVKESQYDTQYLAPFGRPWP